MSYVARLTFLNPRKIYSANSFLRNQIDHNIYLRNNSLRFYSTQPEKSKFRRFYEEYGKLGIGVYLSISVISVSSIYSAIKLGFDMNVLLEKLNLQDNKLVSKAGPFALAYGIHKLFAPARLVLAFLITPLIKKRFF